MSYFRAFRRKCFIHNNGEERLGKFDAKSDGGILVGYFMNSKAYRVSNKRTKIVKESIHIVFDESNDGRLSSFLQELKLSRYDDEEEDVVKAKEHKEPPKRPVSYTHLTLPTKRIV